MCQMRNSSLTNSGTSTLPPVTRLIRSRESKTPAITNVFRSSRVVPSSKNLDNPSTAVLPFIMMTRSFSLVIKETHGVPHKEMGYAAGRIKTKQVSKGISQFLPHSASALMGTVLLHIHPSLFVRYIRTLIILILTGR